MFGCNINKENWDKERKLDVFMYNYRIRTNEIALEAFNCRANLRVKLGSALKCI